MCWSNTEYGSGLGQSGFNSSRNNFSEGIKEPGNYQHTQPCRMKKDPHRAPTIPREADPGGAIPAIPTWNLCLLPSAAATKQGTPKAGVRGSKGWANRAHASAVCTRQRY